MLESVDPYEIDHGGNMDFNSTRPGSTVHIRAQKPGGLLTLADAHARMSDGELTGTGVEIDTAVTIRVDRSPGFSTSSPGGRDHQRRRGRGGIPHRRSGPHLDGCRARGVGRYGGPHRRPLRYDHGTRELDRRHHRRRPPRLLRRRYEPPRPTDRERVHHLPDRGNEGAAAHG